MKERFLLAGRMPLAPASLVLPLAFPAGIVGAILIGFGRTFLLLLTFAVIGAIWLVVGSVLFLLGSALRGALKVDRHANGLFQTIFLLLKPLVLFYAVAYIAIEFWPNALLTTILGLLFGLAVVVYWLAIFFGGLLADPDEALASIG